MNKPKPEHRNFRCPKRLDDMIVLIQQLRSCDFTEALVWILTDWEKFRLEAELKRLRGIHEDRLYLIQHELDIKKQ